jgi:hypothetical protein
MEECPGGRELPHTVRRPTVTRAPALGESAPAESAEGRDGDGGHGDCQFCSFSHVDMWPQVWASRSGRIISRCLHSRRDSDIAPDT